MSRDSLLGVEPGQIIAERYRVEALIGRGAMGAVWRATHLGLASPLAIKFLNPSIAGDPDMLERFMREARSAALVRSTHVVQIFDYGVERGLPYIAMELLVGDVLESRIAERGPLSNDELDKIFGEVARAVGVAHDAGVIHRDLKPGNVFLAREGAHEITKVLDFGIAKLLDQKLSAPADAGTQTGIMLGTPHYMSPEQARGNRSVDHRTDLWSLAVLCFECLTGRLPFEGQALGDLMVNICTRPPLVPSAVASVPPGFDEWFLKGVMKEPGERFQSAVEMAESLHEILVGVLADVTERPVVAHRTITGGSPSVSLTTHGASTTESRAATAARRRSATTGWVLALGALSLSAAYLGFFAFRSGVPRTPEGSPVSSPSAARSSAASSAPAPDLPAPTISPAGPGPSPSVERRETPVSQDDATAERAESPPVVPMAPEPAKSRARTPRPTKEELKPAVPPPRARGSEKSPDQASTAPRMRDTNKAVPAAQDPFAERL